MGGYSGSTVSLPSLSRGVLKGFATGGSLGRMYMIGGDPSGTPSGSLNFKITDVKQIDFGESHLLVLKGDGEVYSWGTGTLGQLGTGARGWGLKGNGNDLYHVWPLANRMIVQVSCGGEHSAAVGKNGDLYTWGRGYEGYEIGYKST
jgi:hypothetical protein